MWRVVVCDQETSCDEEAKKKRTEPLGNACSKTLLSNLGQNKKKLLVSRLGVIKCKRYCVSHTHKDISKA
jgi:hypothetical protein